MAHSRCHPLFDHRGRNASDGFIRRRLIVRSPQMLPRPNRNRESAGLGIGAHRIGRGQRVARRQDRQLNAPRIEESAERDQNGVGVLARHAGEGRIDVAAGGDLANQNLPPAGRRLGLAESMEAPLSRPSTNVA
jgi:hypothetical protein